MQYTTKTELERLIYLRKQTYSLLKDLDKKITDICTYEDEYVKITLKVIYKNNETPMDID